MFDILQCNKHVTNEVHLSRGALYVHYSTVHKSLLCHSRLYALGLLGHSWTCLRSRVVSHCLHSVALMRILYLFGEILEKWSYFYSEVSSETSIFTPCSSRNTFWSVNFSKMTSGFEFLSCLFDGFDKASVLINIVVILQDSIRKIYNEGVIFPRLIRISGEHRRNRTTYKFINQAPRLHPPGSPSLDPFMRPSYCWIKDYSVSW